MIRPYRGTTPTVAPSVFVAESAEIIGDVVIGEDSSVWFHAVVRGDVNFIRIGSRTNIQDGAILHVTHDARPLIIGSDITVGHGAIVHACTVNNGCLIGMGSIVLDGAVIGRNSLVAAGSLVKMNEIVPEGVLVAGTPARVVRELSPPEIASILESASGYVETAKYYQSGK